MLHTERLYKISLNLTFQTCPPPLRSAFILLIHYFKEVNNNAHKCQNTAIFELTWENILPDLHVGGSNSRRPGEVWKSTSVLHRFRPEKGGAVSWWCSVISWASILAVRVYRPFTLLIFEHCSKHSTSMRERRLVVDSLVDWCHRISACHRRLGICQEAVTGALTITADQTYCRSCVDWAVTSWRMAQYVAGMEKR